MQRVLPAASTEDLIRASLKDADYIGELARGLREAAELLLPNRVASRLRAGGALSAAATLLYHLAGARAPVPCTPGEEYAGVAPVVVRAGARLALPGPARAALLAALLAAHRLDGVAFCRRAWHALRRRRRRRSAAAAGDAALVDGAAFPADALARAAAAAAHVHLALFYLRGAHFAPAARAARVRYVRTALRPPPPAAPYRALGALLLVQAAVSAACGLRAAARRARRAQARAAGRAFAPLLARALLFPQQSLAAEPAPRHAPGKNAPGGGERAQRRRRTCALCLGDMAHATVTACGHLFCWHCIMHWCMTKEICPLCRRHMSSRKLVCLYQF